MSAVCLPKAKLIQALILFLALAGSAFKLPAQHSVTNCTSAANLIAQLELTNHIVFECAGTITVTSPIIITGDVILDASDRIVTINGNNATRIFSVQPGATLTLINLILTGGKASHGPAIRNEGSVYATNCIFAGNNAVGPNGANGADGRDDNTTPTDGGDGQFGTSGLGGAIWSNETLVLSRCRFNTNSATGGNGGNGGKGGDGINGSFYSGDGGHGGPGGVGRGGAIYNSGYAEIWECVFHQNRVTGGNGGAFGPAGTGGIVGIPGRAGQGALGTGAAIHNAGEVGIDSSTFSDNRADGGDSPANAGESSSGNGNAGLAGGEAWGGAVCNLSIANVLNSTFSTNRVFGGDGGKGADGEFRGGRGGNGGTAFGGSFYNNGTGAITNCTFAGGAARGGTNGVGGAGPTLGAPGTLGLNRGGNLARVGGTLDLQSTIVCRPGTGANGFGAVFDLGHNISSDNSIVLGAGGSRMNTLPQIGDLADNEGFGRTFALVSGSPCIDAGDEFYSPEVDQRGFPRFGFTRDIGAYEFAASSVIVHVTDVEGEPVEGVRIVGGGMTNFTTTTGIADFPPLPAGEYTFTPSHAIYSFDPPLETVTLGPGVDIFFTALRTFSLSGYVRDGTSGIDNVTVTAGTEQAVTDTNGFYQISGLDPGPYTIVPESPGYDFIPGLQQMDLQEDTTNVNFTAVGRHSISGRITENGQGLANVVVRAGNRSAVTGPTGNYTITEVPQRQQIVTPSLFGHSFNPRSHTLIPTGDENGIDFTAFASYQVSGVVLNSSNSLGANAVTLTLRTNTMQSGPPPPGTPAPLVLLSDTNGLFSFTNLAAGNYVLTPSRPGHAFLPATNALTLGPSANLTYQMFPVYSMSGRVTAGGSGLSNATIIVRTNGGGEVARMTTSANGGYTFASMPAGSYELSPLAQEGYEFTPTNRVVDLAANATGLDFASAGTFSIRGEIMKGATGLPNVVVRAGGFTDVTDANGRYELLNLTPGTYTVTPEEPRHSFQPLTSTVTVGPSRTNVNFQAVEVYTINGEVREGNLPMVGARITAGGVTNFTGPTGRYTLSRVPAGSNVVVEATLPGYQFTPAQQTIVLDSIKHGIDFTARGLSAVSGRVTDAITSNGVGSVKITVAGRYETNTSPTGFYTITNVGPGLHTVVPSRTNRGFNPASQQVNVLTNSVTNNVNFVAFRASKLFGRITLEETTNGISGVSVRVEGAFGTNIVTTDANGNYEFASLRNGFYRLTPTQSNRGFDPQYYEFDLGADTQRDFVGFQGFSISGRIIDGTAGVAGLQVNVNTPEISSTITDTNGFYTLSGLREGDYTVTPVGIGYDVTPGDRQVSLGPTNAINVNFVARGNLSVSGRVLEGSVGVSNIQVRLTGTNVTRTATSDTSGTFTFANLTPGLVSIHPLLIDLFTPTNIVVDPLNYPAPIFNANGGKLSVSRSNNVIKVSLRALPARFYTLQTNLNGVGPWGTIGPRFTDANGLMEYLHTNSPSTPALIFRTRRP